MSLFKLGKQQESRGEDPLLPPRTPPSPGDSSTQGWTQLRSTRWGRAQRPLWGVGVQASLGM